MTADRLRGLSDEELGLVIRASEPAWPATPPLAQIVAERIRETERLPQLRPRLSLPSRRRTILILVAAILLMAAAAVAARLVVRIGAETVTVVSGPPTLPADVLTPEVLGRPAASLAEAGSLAGFDVALPTRLGDPTGVWTGPTPPDTFGNPPVTRVVLAWSPTPVLPAVRGLPWGAVLMEFPGEANLAAKTIFEGAGGSMRPVTVDGRDALWVTGEHTITLAAADGGAPVELRVTGNVLLWQQGDLTLRLETALGLPSASAIAASTP